MGEFGRGIGGGRAHDRRVRTPYRRCRSLLWTRPPRGDQDAQERGHPSRQSQASGRQEKCCLCIKRQRGGDCAVPWGDRSQCARLQWRFEIGQRGGHVGRISSEQALEVVACPPPVPAPARGRWTGYVTSVPHPKHRNNHQGLQRQPATTSAQTVHTLPSAPRTSSPTSATLPSTPPAPNDLHPTP